MRGLRRRPLARAAVRRLLIALAGIDLDHKLLPNKIVYPMAVYGLVASALVDIGDFPEHLIAGAGAFAFLLVAVLAYPAGWAWAT